MNYDEDFDNGDDDDIEDEGCPFCASDEVTEIYDEEINEHYFKCNICREEWNDYDD